MNYYAETTTRPRPAILKVLNHIPLVASEVYDWKSGQAVSCEYHEIPSTWTGALKLIGIDKSAMGVWVAFEITDHPVEALKGAQVRMTTTAFHEWLDRHEFQNGNQIIGNFALGPARLLTETPYVETRN